MHPDARPPGKRCRRSATAAGPARVACAAIIALVLSLASCAPYAAAADGGLNAFALAEAQAAQAARILEGRRELVNEWNFTLPASDFSRVITMNANEALSRIRSGDPRRTPLIDGLARAFRLRVDGQAWAIMYHAGGDQALFDALDELSRAGIAALALSRGRPAPVGAEGAPTGNIVGLGAALALSLWYLFRLAAGDRAFRAVVGMSWLPFIAAPGLGGGLAAVATAALAGELGLILALRRPRRDELVYAVLIYGPVASLAAASEPFALVPAGAAALWIAAVALRRERLLAWCNASRLHGPPAFIPISRPSPARSYARGAPLLALAVALVGASSLVAGWGTRADRPAADPGATLRGLAVEMTRLDPSLDGMDPLEAHAAYQAALTWGRLGDAAWGRFDPEGLLTPRDLGTADPKEIVRASFAANALHKALDSGYIPTIRATEALVPAGPYRGISLLALLAALAPAISLFIHGRLRSR